MADNPNAFKYWINKEVMEKMAEAISKVYKPFAKKQFMASAPKLDALELKPRVQFIRDELKKHLPENYNEALKILLKSLDSNTLDGFDLWPYTEYVQTYGLHDLKNSINALYQITERFTGEFAIRPFLKKYPSETLKFLNTCAKDKNHHVRRWASEGSRPRLPWGEKLQIFIDDPTQTLPILEKLKFDEELYVRKSVSNHLNDIAKDHPDIVISLLKKWKTEAEGTAHESKIQWIIHRALRTLIKDGNPKALELIGAAQKIKIKVTKLKVNQKNFKMGDKVEFEFQIISESKKSQKTVVDYIIHHVKSNKTTSPKVFKLKTITLKPGEAVVIKKTHHLKFITTRQYHAGTHFLEIQINGKVYERSQWTLTL